jgi:hypothetical protein
MKLDVAAEVMAAFHQIPVEQAFTGARAKLEARCRTLVARVQKNIGDFAVADVDVACLMRLGWESDRDITVLNMVMLNSMPITRDWLRAARTLLRYRKSDIDVARERDQEDMEIERQRMTQRAIRMARERISKDAHSKTAAAQLRDSDRLLLAVMVMHGFCALHEGCTFHSNSEGRWWEVPAHFADAIRDLNCPFLTMSREIGSKIIRVTVNK